MNSKMPLAYVLGIVLLIPFAYLIFLGEMFLNDGSIGKSVTITILLAVLIGGSIWLMPASKSSNRLQLGKMGEIGAWMIFLGSAIYAFIVPVGQFFNVQSNMEAVSREFDAGRESAKKIYPAYEQYARDRIAQYTSTLHTVANGKASRPAEYQEMLGVAQGATDEAKIEKLTTALQRSILPESNDVINNFNTWISGLGALSVWNPMTMNNIATLDEKVNELTKSLVQLSSNYNPGEDRIPFEYSEYTSQSTNMKELCHKWHFCTNPLAWIIFVACFVAWILPWIIAERSVKGAGSSSDGPQIL